VKGVVEFPVAIAHPDFGDGGVGAAHAESGGVERRAVPGLRSSTARSVGIEVRFDPFRDFLNNPGVHDEPQGFAIDGQPCRKRVGGCLRHFLRTGVTGRYQPHERWLRDCRWNWFLQHDFAGVLPVGHEIHTLAGMGWGIVEPVGGLEVVPLLVVAAQNAARLVEVEDGAEHKRNNLV